MFAIGANPWIWTSPVTDDVLADLVPRLAGWGFDAIEIPVEDLDDWSPEKTRDLLATHGITAASVIPVTHAGRDLVNTDPDTVRRSQDFLRAAVDRAVVLGAPNISGPSYAAVGRTWHMAPAERAACYAQLREGLAPVADHAGERGVQIGLEPMSRYETSVLNTVEQALEAVEGLPANVGLMIDSYHMNIEEADPYAAVTLAGTRLVHVQVSGSNRGAPGDDHIDWPRWLQALADTGWRGPICIESFTAANAGAPIWRPFAPTQDTLATNGLRYLREVSATLTRRDR